MLGNAQMEWLEEQLLACQGPFIILSTGTMWSDQVSSGKDSWGIYDPDSREKIFTLIEENNIGGILLISGDRHGGRVFTIPRPSGYKFYEFEPATLGGRVGPLPTNVEWTDQLYGVSGEYAFGEFVFDTSVPDPTVTFNLVSESGTIFYQMTLSRSQLMPR
jgi:alkaline phosphatase D